MAETTAVGPAPTTSSGLETKQQAEYAEMSLPQLYYSVRRKMAKLKNTPPRDINEHKALMAECLDQLKFLDKRVEESDIFSPNETIDDVSTESLKYLNVAYDLGDMYLNTTLDPSRRGDFVKAGVMALRRFLDRCDLLMLLTEEAKRAYDGKEPKLDPQAARAAKIAKFKREKELESKIAALEERINEFHKQRRRQRRQGGVGAEDDKNEEDVPYGLEAVEEGEVHPDERELILLYIDLNIDRALAHLSFAKQELELIEFGQRMQAERAQAGMQGPPMPSRPMPSASAVNSQVPRPPEAVPSAPPVVHHFTDRADAATAPIPEHMKKFLQRIQRPEDSAVAAAAKALSATTISGPSNSANPMAWKGRQQYEQEMREAQIARAAAESCGSNCGHDHHSHSGDPNAPWFKPSGMAHEHTEFYDVRQQAPQFMLTKVRGGRGVLVPVCPIHGNDHPAGQCPGLSNAGNTSRTDGMATLLKDRVQEMIALRTDRTQVFRDSNPYLMELDDWARMKQAEGYLPGERDVELARKRREEEEARRQRLEDGEESDEEQRKTQREIEEEEEKAQREAREWDNWKDDHEKGAGNRKYRR